MAGEEAFHAFLFGLQPHLQEHVGAHVQGDLEAAIAMASVSRFIVVEMGPRHQAKDPKSLKIRKSEMWRRSRGARLGGPSRWSRS